MDDEAITALALAARRGDERASVQFVRATTPQLRRVLTHLGGGADVEDLVQETYLRAFDALPRYRRRAPARLWLLAIARRVAADHVRTAMRRPRTTGMDDEHLGRLRPRATPTGAVELADLIARLEPERREAFVLTRVAGLSYAEAAELCGCPVGTIRSRVHRARLDLVAAVDAADGPGDDNPEVAAGR